MSFNKHSESNLLVVCHDESEFKNISQILGHYFPNQNKQSNLLISNKYYRAHVNLLSKTWAEVLNFHLLNDDNQQQKANQAESQQANEGEMSQNSNQISQSKENTTKYDLMIMLVNQTQQNIINFQSLDSIIESFNPEEFVLLINTTTPQDSWAHEETILQKCNNFIEIVKEDLWKVNKIRPNWARGALLNNEEESDESGIFSILDRMETTRWTTMVNVKKQQTEKESQIQQKPSQTSNDKPKELKLKNEEQKTKDEDIQQKLVQVSENPTSTKPKNEANNSSDDQEMDQKRIEQQMREFEGMMSQMMSFKVQSTGMKDQERKSKAQQLFATMFKGMTNYQ